MFGKLLTKARGVASRREDSEHNPAHRADQFIRKLEIKAQRLAQQRLLGRYRSRFKGRGLEFRDFREYLPGDDVRTIDWNVTARFGRPFVKNSEEERELSVVLILDLSPSQNFGSGQQTKRELAQQLATLMGLTALASGDKLGLALSDGKISRYLAPGKGRHHKNRLLQAIWQPLSEQRDTGSGDLLQTLEELSRQLRRRGFLCLISDFLQPELLRPELVSQLEQLQAALRKLSFRHETIALRTYDQRERRFPNSGVLTLRDQTDGRTVRVDTSHPDWKHAFQKRWESWNLTLLELMRKTRWDCQEFQTDIDPLPVLANFLDARGRK